ncbi:MAG: hypothetical protein QXR09_03340 [Candidatus Aenigmatarchaeota archaeon]
MGKILYEIKSPKEKKTFISHIFLVELRSTQIKYVEEGENIVNSKRLKSQSYLKLQNRKNEKNSDQFPTKLSMKLLKDKYS